MDERKKSVLSMQRRVEKYYMKKGMPVDEQVQLVIKNSLELGLSEDEVVENLMLRNRLHPPPHLIPISEIMHRRSDGNWIEAKLTSVDEEKGYVVEWEKNGELFHKVVSFDNTQTIRPRTGFVPPDSDTETDEDDDLEIEGSAPVGQCEIPQTSRGPSPPKPEKPVATPAPEPVPAPVTAPVPTPAPVPVPEPVKEEPKKEVAKEEPAPVVAAAVPSKSASFKQTGPFSFDNLVCEARGDGIFDDASYHLNDRKVQFLLVQIPLGSGTFKRKKLIMINFHGPDCPPMERAKHVQQTGAVAEVFGNHHASLTISSDDECCLDHVLKELKHVFVSDNGDFSIEGLKKEINDLVEAGRQQQQDAIMQAAATMAELPNLRPTAADMGLSASDVMKEIRKPLGAMNWALFEADPSELKLIDAGSDSIPEMQSNLDDKKVMFGIIRLGFGMGSFRRTKWVCVTFVGSSIGAVARGRSLNHKGEMERLLKPHQVSIEIQGSEDLTVEGVIEKVRPYVVSDNIEKGNMAITLGDFNKALAEEKVAAASFYGENPAATMANLSGIFPSAEEEQDYDVKDTIEAIKGDDPLLWGVFSLKQ